MLKVFSGVYEENLLSYIRGKVMSNFDRRVTRDWISSDLVRSELRDVDDVVSIDGLTLMKSTGREIPVQFISQGSKQFIMEYINPGVKAVDCCHVGWNVYKYFNMLAENTDVFLLVNTNDCLSIKDYELHGYYMNAGKYFNTTYDLVGMIYDYQYSVISELQDGNIINAQHFSLQQVKGRSEEDDVILGKKYSFVFK